MSGRPIRRLVLASGSPRRHALLAAAGFTFDVVVPDADETPFEGEDPADMVTRLAVAKVAAATNPASRDACILGVDTTVVLDGVILGKPRDEADAVEILLRLAGRSHLVHSGFAASIPAEGIEETGVATTAVQIRPIGRDEARAYAASGEPLDKAGAYGIQGEGGRFVASVAGSRSNVAGLPIGDIVPLLHRLGVPSQRRPPLGQRGHT